MELRKMIEEIEKNKKATGGIKNVIWLAAGGSYGGFYPGHYFWIKRPRRFARKILPVMNLLKHPQLLLEKIL